MNIIKDLRLEDIELTTIPHVPLVTRIWIEDDELEDGGRWKKLRKPRPGTPLLNVNFKAKVITDYPLKPNSVHKAQDGNLYIVTQNNEIRNVQNIIQVFQLPTMLAYVYSAFSEGGSR